MTTTFGVGARVLAETPPAPDLAGPWAPWADATIEWGGRMGLYDFTDNQRWNPLRHRRIVIRGVSGEIADDRLVRLADPRTPVASAFDYRRTGTDLNPEGNDLQHASLDGRMLYRNPVAGTPLSEDDVAVADVLERTSGGSAKTGRDVTTEREAWAR